MIKPWEASMVRLESDYDDIMGQSRIIKAEYDEKEDPRVLMSMELWLRADWDQENISITNPFPVVGAEISLIDLKFKIIGFNDRYSVPQNAWTYDIVLEKI